MDLRSQQVYKGCKILSLIEVVTVTVFGVWKFRTKSLHIILYKFFFFFKKKLQVFYNEHSCLQMPTYTVGSCCLGLTVSTGTREFI